MSMDKNTAELAELVNSLKETIRELRGFLDEITNPVLGTPQIIKERVKSVKREEKQAEQEAAYKRNMIIVPSPSQETKKPPEDKKQEHLPVEEELLEAVKPVAEYHRREELGLDRLARLMRLIYELQAKVPSEYLVGLAEVLYGIGLIDEAQRDTLKKLIELTRVSYEHGMSIDENIAILAALAKELGLNISTITEELVRAILRQRGVEAWGSRQQ